MFVTWTVKRDDNAIYRILDLDTQDKQTCIGSDEVEDIIFQLNEEGARFVLVEGL